MYIGDNENTSDKDDVSGDDGKVSSEHEKFGESKKKCLVVVNGVQ